MNTYKVHINDRNYSTWEFYKMTDLTRTELTIVPSEHKLFTNDVFSLINTNTECIVELLHSSIRSCGYIPGVLILAGSKTYGRAKNGKLLYKCVPDDMRMPSFLIPYEMKRLGFSKVYDNLYITFQFIEWTDKHPHGVISQSIGPISELYNFYEYQLYCKSLNASIQKFNKDTSQALKTNAASHNAFIENICKKYPSIEDRTDNTKWSVFTIDPVACLDFDDAFSIRELADGQKMLSIYISNVTIWMDVLNLWDSFSNRISTIYLPDRKRPMLPTILSDCLCSLQSNNTRIAFVMDLIIENDIVIDVKYSNSMIRIYKNYCYEEPTLLTDNNYKILMTTAQSLLHKYKYMNSIGDSHDIVSYLMIFMNFHCAKELLNKGNGIFRSAIMTKNVTCPESLPDGVSKFIKIWNSSSGQYIDINKIEHAPIRHDLLEMDAYVHITSPIRRIVDLLNIIQIQKNMGIIQLSENSNRFYDNWVDKLEYINTTMRSIRKVQSECSMLEFCNDIPDMINREYDGYIFDSIERNDGLYQMLVYLPDVKLTSRVVVRENIKNYEMRKFKMYVFNNEEKFKKKIRLQLV